MAFYAAKVGVQFILAVGQLPVSGLLQVGVLWQCDPLPACDLAVYHEPQRIEDVALKSLEASSSTHGADLDAVLHDHCN